MWDREQPLVLPSGVRVDEICRMVLGSVLMTAAIFKLLDLVGDPVSGVDDRGITVLRDAVAVPELLLSLWLSSGFRPVLAHRLSVGCFMALSCVALTQAVRGAESCGCFGQARISPWLILLFDLAAVALLLVLRPAPGRAAAPRARRRVLVGLASSLVAAVGVVYLATALTPHYMPLSEAGPGGDRVIWLDPVEWVGKKFDLMKHIDIDADLSRGLWTVVLYHHDCPRCQEAISGYELLARRRSDRPDVPRIALVEVPPYAGTGEGPVRDTSACVIGRLRGSNEWFVQTPAVISLREGIVSLPDSRSRVAESDGR